MEKQKLDAVCIQLFITINRTATKAIGKSGLYSSAERSASANCAGQEVSFIPVSYTHLDVYKRHVLKQFRDLLLELQNI